uniref:Uncharacterized protein n=1 Tax=Arundo donax TaxID=35708 RepID=A0A0A9HQG4_ARUDO
MIIQCHTLTHNFLELFTYYACLKHLSCWHRPSLFDVIPLVFGTHLLWKSISLASSN